MWLCLLAASLLAADTPAADTWPGFRGDGSSRTLATDLPLTWSPSENIAWRASLPGYGQSAPAVWRDHVYVTSVEGDEKEKLHVTCLDSATGKQLWVKTFAATQKGKNNPMMSRAAGVPVLDAAGLYALFESGDLFALTHDGSIRWKRHFSQDFGELKNNHGLGSSPAQTPSSVIVLLDHQGPSKLLSIDKSTGRNNWVIDRAPRSSWTSPIVLNLGNQQQVVVSSSGTLTGYNAQNGTQLWEQIDLVGNNIPSPTFSGNRLVIAASENRMKPDAEATSQSNRSVTLGPDGRRPRVNWSARRFSAGMASPLIHEGYVYLVDKSGFVLCLEEQSGEEKYRERLESQQWATPIGAPGRVYFFGKDGITTVLKTGGEFEKLAVNRLWSAEESTARREAAKKEAEAKLPKPPQGKGPGGGPPVPKAEAEAARYSAVGDVVYGAAASGRQIYLRSGSELISLRTK